MFMVLGKFVRRNGDCYRNFWTKIFRQKSSPVVKPGTQSRRFTHIDDTIKICFWRGKKMHVNFTALQIKKVIL